MKDTFFDINDTLFRIGIRVYYGNPPPFFGDIVSTIDARSITDKPFNPCIWIRDKNNIGVLVHELVHCVADIHRKKGIPQNSDTEEVFAYMMDYYTTNIIKKFKNIS